MRNLVIALLVLGALAAAVALFLREPKQAPPVRTAEADSESTAARVERLMTTARQDAPLTADLESAQAKEGVTVRQMSEFLDSSFSEWRMGSARRFRVAGEHLVIDESVFAGSLKRPVDRGVPMGRVSARVLTFSWMDGDTVSRMASYNNIPNAWLRQLGAKPPGVGGVARPPASPGETEEISAPGAPGRVDALREALAAFGKADKSPFSKVFTQKTRFEDITENLVMRGVDALSKRLAPVEEAFPDAVATVDHAYAVGDYALLGLRWSGTFSGRLGDIEPTGEKVELRFGLVARFEGDHAVEVRTYWSRHKLDRAVRPGPQGPALDMDPNATVPQTDRKKNIVIPPPVPPGSPTSPTTSTDAGAPQPPPPAPPADTQTPPTPTPPVETQTPPPAAPTPPSEAPTPPAPGTP